jgi:hypothetical protein
MKTQSLGPILAVTIVAGLLTAFSSARPNNSRAEVPLQTANHERVEHCDHPSGAVTPLPFSRETKTSLIHSLILGCFCAEVKQYRQRVAPCATV